MFKAQSAMEYLITYGWAILIIIVALSALYALGVFNSDTYAGKAATGSCQVYRPYGPGTIQLVNLQGVCSSIEPKEVAVFNGAGQITVPSQSLLQANAITVSAWVKITTSTQYMIFDRGLTFTSGSFYMWGSPSDPEFTDCGISGCYNTLFNTNALQTGTWYNLVSTFNPSTGITTSYLNGVQVATSSSGLIPSTSNIVIGSYLGGSGYALNGLLSNIQLYNTSLSGNDVKALYVEGIGGPPTQLQNLVGWWPLNGDTKDYSGNGNNGNSIGVYFESAWTSGYSIP
ncbi:MAG: LamG domain-containing protein [Candidatus Micrarchaeaceae archaeon]|jgi:hypothetical protein